MVGLRTWVATILAFVTETSGIDGLTAALHDEAPFLQTAEVPPPAVTADAIVAQAAGGSSDEALRQWDELDSYYRVHHDWWVDRVSVLLSHVYRTLGVDGLERSLRFTGRDFLLPWMPFDIQHPPRRRLRVWTETAKGNMSTIAAISEDDEKFTITMDPCGSCGRQVAEREFPGPLPPGRRRRGLPAQLRPRGDVGLPVARGRDPPPDPPRAARGPVAGHPLPRSPPGWSLPHVPLQGS